LKRAPFVGAVAAVVLTGCGGRHVFRALPGVATSETHVKQPRRGELVPAAADPIPNNVLTNPIIGEGWRFDGPAAPSGWMLAQGQTVTIAADRPLFSILGTAAGGDGKVSFRLPNPGYGFIVAVAGTFPSSPAVIAQSGRRMTDHQDSLGKVPTSLRTARVRPERERALADARRLQASAIRVGPSNPMPTSPEMLARFTESRFTARDVALGILRESNRTVFAAVAERLAQGEGSLNDAVVRMTPLLSADEASALLEANDARIRAFRDVWYGVRHDNPQYEAARFLVSVGMSRDQLRRFLIHASD
jgi:hypothetical protein